MQAKETLKQHLAKTALLTDQEFDLFFSHFKLQSYKKGQTIITQGNKVDCEYFVVEFAMPTWWASDYNALYTGEKALMNVDCITNAEVLCLSNTDREKLCREIHQVEHFFRWRTNRGYVAAQRRLLSHMNNDTKQRYEELMKLYPALYNMVPKHLIAAYLRSPEKHSAGFTILKM